MNIKYEINQQGEENRSADGAIRLVRFHVRSQMGKTHGTKKAQHVNFPVICDPILLDTFGTYENTLPFYLQPLIMKLTMSVIEQAPPTKFLKSIDIVFGTEESFKMLQVRGGVI
jgi:hypothetical protein